MIERIFVGDCLYIAKNIAENSIDLIYLDPPFFTNKIQKLSTRDGNKEFSYSDVWNNSNEYINFLYYRFIEFKRLLKDNGNIFVHCDRNSSHIIRTILDSIFGEEQFRSEIIWSYKRWSNSKKGLLNSHQTIYFYSKSNNFTFNTIYTEYSESTNLEQILQKREKDHNGKSVYARQINGETVFNGIKKGVPLSDVWEIPYLNPTAKERVGYPTQKPIELLERIIEIASNVGDTILDPFCGSGTTLIAGKLKNRNIIGIDISNEAIEITKNRLNNIIKTESNANSYELDNNEFIKNHLYNIKYQPVYRNSGIDGILNQLFNNKPIFIRVQREKESLEESIEKLYKAIKSKNSDKSFLVRTNNHRTLIEYDNIYKEIEILDSIFYQFKLYLLECN